MGNRERSTPAPLSTSSLPHDRAHNNHANHTTPIPHLPCIGVLTQEESTQRLRQWAQEAEGKIREAEEAHARAQGEHTDEQPRKRKPMGGGSDNPASPQPPPAKDRPNATGQPIRSDGLASMNTDQDELIPPRSTGQEAVHAASTNSRRTNAAISDSESDAERPRWRPLRLENPQEEAARVQLIIDDEIENIKKIPGAAITAAYLEAVAAKTGADQAALWAAYKKTRWTPGLPSRPRARAGAS